MKKKTVKQYLNELSKSKKSTIKNTNNNNYSVIKLDNYNSKIDNTTNSKIDNVVNRNNDNTVNRNNDNTVNRNSYNVVNRNNDNTVNRNNDNTVNRNSYNVVNRNNDNTVNRNSYNVVNRNSYNVVNRNNDNAVNRNNDNAVNRNNNNLRKSINIRDNKNDYNKQNISIKINSKKKGGNNSNHTLTDKIIGLVTDKYHKFSIKKNNVTNIAKKSFNIDDYKSILSKNNIGSKNNIDYNNILINKKNDNAKSIKNIVNIINKEKKEIKSQRKEIKSLKNINNIEKYKILKAKKLLLKKNDYLENLYDKIKLCSMRNNETLKKLNSREKYKNIEEYTEGEKTNIKIKNDNNNNCKLLTIITKKNKDNSNMKTIYDKIIHLDKEELLYLLELRNIKLNKNIPIQMVRDIYFNMHIGFLNCIKK